MKFLLFVLKSLIYQTALLKLRRKGILFYLKALQAIRKSLVAFIFLFFALQMMVLGFAGALVSGIWLLPIEDNQTRLWLLFSASAAFFLIPLLLICVFLSEKNWYKASGAKEMMQAPQPQ